MKEKVDVIDADEDEKLEKVKKDLLKKGFFKRLAPYNRPCFNVLIGLLVSCV